MSDFCRKVMVFPRLVPFKLNPVEVLMRDASWFAPLNPSGTKSFVCESMTKFPVPQVVSTGLGMIEGGTKIPTKSPMNIDVIFTWIEHHFSENLES